MGPFAVQQRGRRDEARAAIWTIAPSG